MRVVSARFVALLFASVVMLAAPVLHAQAQPAPAQTEPAEIKPESEQAAPSQPTAAPDAPDASSEKSSRGGFAGALDRFLENDYDATETGISEAAASGDPRAATVIEALRDERL